MNKAKMVCYISEGRTWQIEQMVLYILVKTGKMIDLQRHFLFTLLYFMDFDYYEKHERYLIGIDYIIIKNKPYPLLFDNIAKKIVRNSLQPNLTAFKKKKKEHIDWELQRFAGWNEKKLFKLFHNDVPYLSVIPHKTLDYESVFYRTRKTSVREYSDE